MRVPPSYAVSDMADASAMPRLPSLLSGRSARPALSAFAAAFVGTLVVALIQKPRPFLGDGANYWELANTFTHHGHFSLLNFESSGRGYVYPLFLLVVKELGDALSWTASSSVKLFNVTVYALIGAVLAPRLAEITWPEQHWGFLRRAVLTAVVIVFWSGELNYPLSDFPGLALALVALIAIASPDNPWLMLIAGAAGAMAINVRAAYLPLMLVLVLIAAAAWFGRGHVQRKFRSRRTLGVCMLVLGFAAVSLPQSIAEHRHYGTWLFIPGRPETVTQEHYVEGMYAQRYDTIVVGGEIYPGIYLDKTGLRILEEQPNDEITSLTGYMGVIFDHPLAMTELLGRHLINGLDMRYTSAYIEHIDSGGKLGLRLAGFLLVFLALVRMLWPAARRSLGPTRWRYPVALVFCCLSSIPTPMQTRYLLPLWVLLCMFVLAPAWPSPVPREQVGLRRALPLVALSIGYLAFMALVWHVVSGAKIQMLH